MTRSERRRRILRVSALCAALLLILAVVVARPASFWLSARILAARFPDVPSVSSADLSAWIADHARRAPLLLDVREPAEYDVSHLPEAVSVPLSPRLADSVLSPDRGIPIVAYCSMGYRSALAVRQLRAAGFTNAVNLEAGIFLWANEGRVVEREGVPVDGVHPYSRWFRWLLTCPLDPAP